MFYLLAVLTALFLAIQYKPALAAENKPVVKVNGTVLYESNLNQIMVKIVPSIIIHGGISPERLAKYRPEAIDRLVNDELMYQEAVNIGLKVGKDRIKNAIEELSTKMGGRKQFKDALGKKGYSISEYEKLLERQFLLDMVVETEINQKAVVTDDAVKEYYEKNKGNYLKPETVTLKHILVSVDPAATEDEWKGQREKAEMIAAKAAGGEDFSVLAWDYSDDPYKYKGGDLGQLHRGRLDPTLEEEVFKLDSGQISGVIKTIYGFHIVKVEEKTPPIQLEFEDVSQKIKRELYESRRSSLREELISRLREKANIVIY